MTKDQSTEIDRPVRRVLSGVIGETSDESTSPAPSGRLACGSGEQGRLRTMMASTVRATLVASAWLAVAMPTAANAKPEDCLNGKNGFREIIDETIHKPDGTPHGSVSFPSGATVTLLVGNIGGDQYGWAQLKGPRASLHRVWLDWTRDGGKTWIQCGPFKGNSQDFPSTTSAQRTKKDKNWKFRACGDEGAGQGGHKCTKWW